LIIYPKNPIVQTSSDERWISLKSNLYNTFVVPKKMLYSNPVFGVGLETFELYNNYIWIKINQSLKITTGSNQIGIDIKNYNPLINKIKMIINRYYPNTY
jgi:hypothetical protein